MGSLHPGRGLAAGVDRGLNTVAGCPDMAVLRLIPTGPTHQITDVRGTLLNKPLGTHHNLVWQLDAERFGGLHVHDQIDAHRLLDR
jgi:hypothetical protein